MPSPHDPGHPGTTRPGRNHLTHARRTARVVLTLSMLTHSTAVAGERTLTTAPHGHQIHHTQAFSPDGRFIYYDHRNEETALATSTAIGRVEVASGREETLYQTPRSGPHGPGAGAVTCCPVSGRTAFIQGLAGADKAEPYAPHRRSGATLGADGSILHLDARDPGFPPAPGALRGGTHAFHWSPNGKRISFTYNDATVPQRPAPDDLRTIGLMIPGRPVEVALPGRGHFDGSAFATIVVPVKPDPAPGSDELRRAFDEGWLGSDAIAFLGLVLTREGHDLTEVFLARLPADPGPATFPATGVPVPPPGITIQRLTRTNDRIHPGVQGPRHWVRPAPDGSWIAFLAKDDHGTVQIFGVRPSGGPIRQLSRLPAAVESPFNWSPDSRRLACAAGGRIWCIDAASGKAQPLTEPAPPARAPRYSVTFSPDGRHVSYNRPVPAPDGRLWLQVMLCDVP